MQHPELWEELPEEHFKKLLTDFVLQSPSAEPQPAATHTLPGTSGGAASVATGDGEQGNVDHVDEDQGNVDHQLAKEAAARYVDGTAVTALPEFCDDLARVSQFFRDVALSTAS